MIPLLLLTAAWLAGVAVWMRSDPISPRWEGITFATALTGCLLLAWAWAGA